MVKVDEGHDPLQTKSVYNLKAEGRRKGMIDLLHAIECNSWSCPPSHTIITTASVVIS